jgi:hypothetical protein
VWQLSIKDASFDIFGIEDTMGLDGVLSNWACQTCFHYLQWSRLYGLPCTTDANYPSCISSKVTIIFELTDGLSFDTVTIFVVFVSLLV